MSASALKSIKYAGTLAAAICFFGAVLVVPTLISPPGYMSRLDTGMWGGYFANARGERVWCACKFFGSNRPSKMVMLTRNKVTEVFSVDRRSSSPNFVYLDLKSGGVRIQAKQLYLGQRYVLGRLTAGRFGDFWQRNDDDAIHGEVESQHGKQDFAIERRLEGQQFVEFCNQYVLGESGFSTINDLHTFLDKRAETSEARAGAAAAFNNPVAP